MELVVDTAELSSLNNESSFVHVDVNIGYVRSSKRHLASSNLSRYGLPPNHRYKAICLYAIQRISTRAFGKTLSRSVFLSSRRVGRDLRRATYSAVAPFCRRLNPLWKSQGNIGHATGCHVRVDVYRRDNSALHRLFRRCQVRR